jgi:hypothetical protein
MTDKDTFEFLVIFLLVFIALTVVIINIKITKSK